LCVSAAPRAAAACFARVSASARRAKKIFALQLRATNNDCEEVPMKYGLLARLFTRENTAHARFAHDATRFSDAS